MRTRFNPPFLLLLEIIFSAFPTNAAFVPTSRPYRIPTFGSTTGPTSTAATTTAVAYVKDSWRKRVLTATAFADAEAEKEGVRNQGESDDNNNNSWIPLRGGFLPNLNKQRLISEVKTLEDYKRVVADEKDRIVCVRFYAPWCRACRAVQSRFQKLAKDYESVKFVEVPLTETNAYLHEGLGVPSLPFAHIYHPTAGLVEERSINKNIFADFKEVLSTYVKGECIIDWKDED